MPVRRARRCAARAGCGRRRRSRRRASATPRGPQCAAPGSAAAVKRYAPPPCLRNMDRSLGDGGMPLLGAARALVRALRRGLGRGDVDADRARLQPARRRARRRVRRDPRRGDELRREQRARVGRPGRHARRQRTRPSGPRPPATGSRSGARSCGSRSRSAYVESTVRDADGAVVSRGDGDVPRAPHATDGDHDRQVADRRFSRGRKRWRFGWIAEAVGMIVLYRLYDWRPRPGRRHDGATRSRTRATSSTPSARSASTTSARSSRRSCTPTGSWRSGTSTTAPSTSCCRSSRSCGSTARRRRATCAGATRSCSCGRSRSSRSSCTR